MSNNNFAKTFKDIEFIKTQFQRALKANLGLHRVSAPLFLHKDSGLNDDLSGKEEKVSFMNGDLEIVQSLAKWKRYALDKYNIKGLYTDMNAIRQSEVLDPIHSMYVDQWDWEVSIQSYERTKETLKMYVKAIFRCIKEVDIMLTMDNFNRPMLLNGIKEPYFITSEDLVKQFPDISNKNELEKRIAMTHKVVFIENIGYDYDIRAPDYDDWTLNGDLIVWNPILNDALELSSMGIRVNSISLERQLKHAGLYEQKKNLSYHRSVLNNNITQSIGGGVGQSRLCMWLLQKKHIAEVQCSYWGDLDIPNML